MQVNSVLLPTQLLAGKKGRSKGNSRKSMRDSQWCLAVTRRQGWLMIGFGQIMMWKLYIHQWYQLQSTVNGSLVKGLREFSTIWCFVAKLLTIWLDEMSCFTSMVFIIVIIFPKQRETFPANKQLKQQVKSGELEGDLKISKDPSLCCSTVG